MTVLRKNLDRAAGWAAIAVGGLLLVIGWFGVSDQVFVAGQLPYVISGGIGGIAFIGTGAVLLLSADLQDEWRKLDALESKLDQVLARPVLPGAVPSVEPAPRQRRRARTGVEGGDVLLLPDESAR